MSGSKARKAEARKLLRKAKGDLLPVDLSDQLCPVWMTRAFRNNRCTVMIDDNAVMPGGLPAIRAMVQRHDDKPMPRHWREMQGIKNELFGDEARGIEFYPKVSELVDDHNIYWLWVLPD